MLSKMLLLVLVSVTLTHAFYPGNHLGHRRQSNNYLSRCTGSNKPCRLNVEMINATGAIIQSASSQQCSCNSHQGACSSDWSDPHKVISRNLRSATLNVTIQMMFCSSVIPCRNCSSGEIALEMSGSLIIPDTLENYQCRCNDSLPLYLVHHRTENYRFYDKYVCASNWNTCEEASRCMTVRRSSTEYHCKCPPNQVCTPPTWRQNSIEIIVYCSSR